MRGAMSYDSHPRFVSLGSGDGKGPPSPPPPPPGRSPCYPQISCPPSPCPGSGVPRPGVTSYRLASYEQTPRALSTWAGGEGGISIYGEPDSGPLTVSWHVRRDNKLGGSEVCAGAAPEARG